MKRLKTYLLLLCLMPFFSLNAKDIKLKISETTFYFGEAKKKVPMGMGTLYVMDRPSKEPVLRQDIITGVFNGNHVSSAEVIFSSGWQFKGELTYKTETISKKPLQSVFYYYLTGNITDPTGIHHYPVENLEMARTTTGKSGSLVTESMVFASEHNVIRLIIQDDIWKATPYVRIAPAIYYQGENNTGIPSGKGIMFLLDSDNLLSGHYYDKVSGDFSGNHIANANYAFSSGWHFNGSLTYDFETIKADPYSVNLTYTLEGELSDPNGEKDIVTGGKLKRVLMPGDIRLIPFTWEQNIQVSNDRISEYEDFVDYTFVYSPTMCEIKENTDKTWTASYEPATDNLEFHYSTGHIIAEYEDGFSIQYPNSDFFEIRNNQITGLLKSFPGSIMHMSEDQSNIFYFDGGRYIGTFMVEQIMCHSNYSQRKTNLQRLMRPDLFLDEVTLMYVDGVYTYSNGKTESWKNGITDYQQNEINGNYDKVSDAIKKTLQEGLAAEGAELERKWQEVLPWLREEYGARNVDAIYNYRLNRRTPLELFQELARLGLIDFVGPTYATKLKNTCHEYIIAMRNRETGMLQYSLILKFVHPFVTSPDWILDRYSTNYN